jgi:hypothetical protein
MTKRLSVSVTTNNATLEASYNQYRSRPDFNLVEIAGYPALISRSNVNLPSCDIDIKLAERQSVSITYIAREFSSNPQQSCVAAKQVMAAVVMNVPPKSCSMGPPSLPLTRGRREGGSILPSLALTNSDAASMALEEA